MMSSVWELGKTYKADFHKILRRHEARGWRTSSVRASSFQWCWLLVTSSFWIYRQRACRPASLQWRRLSRNTNRLRHPTLLYFLLWIDKILTKLISHEKRSVIILTRGGFNEFTPPKMFLINIYIPWISESDGGRRHTGIGLALVGSSEFQWPLLSVDLWPVWKAPAGPSRQV